tara:strand:- start:241 stop:534 length:294 start_codon:yes stop_codon:yes gene_type:complete
MKTFKQFTEERKFGPDWNDGANVRFHVGPNKKEVSLNYNGQTIASKKTETSYKGRSPKVAVDQALIGLKNQENAHIGRNYVARKNAENKKDVLIAKK